MNGNLAGILRDAAAAHPARPALLHDGVTIDYAALDAHAARFAGLLRSRGVASGDRVAIVLPNVPEFVAAYHGALAAGAIVVPLNVLLRGQEIESRVADSEPRVLVGPAGRAGELGPIAERCGALLLDPSAADGVEPDRELAARDGTDTAALGYTSGTSGGGVKAVELTHEGLRWNARGIGLEILELTPEDVILGAAPLPHILGQSGGMNTAIVGGACLALVPRFEAGPVLELMQRAGITVMLGVPTMCIALLQAAEGTASPPRLRVAHVGGAPVMLETARAFGERFGCPVRIGYGMTEVAGLAVAEHPGAPRKPGSVGTPLTGLEIRVEDGQEVGELQVRGPSVMTRYWRKPEASAEALDPDGWFATGDVGSVDADGYVFLLDRKKDVILRGGYSVYPFEVEDVLHRHPGVLEAAVVGVPDETLGEEVVAVVVARDGAECDPDEIRQFARERVAAYKYPRLVVVADTLPRGPSGKLLKREIDRRALREALTAAVATRTS